ncbi:ATP-dependent DNA ligase [Gottfriedia acidiceleris]|uniref:ATP-dependent DNA ligase n=1 Tax=Gottfriedia acidiceleris TaxID=371036 RepID=UPI00101D9229|nr:ATP-dependent DNA ligase [Gottfriedia acidiceleris]
MFIEPMLLQNADKPFDSDQHYFELKSNGVRMMLERQNGKNKLFNRNGTEITERIPELENIDLDDCYLDGVLVCYNDGREDFEAATNRVSFIQEYKILQGSKQFPSTYIVFDILRLKNNNLMKEPLSYRKKILSETLVDQESIKKSFYIESEGKMLFEQIKTLGLEGIVAKSKDSTYIPAHRSLNWLKIINWRYSNYYITGYKKQGMGLLISELKNGEYVNVGLVEFGMNIGQKTAFFSLTKHIKTGEDKNYIYVEPFVRCVIKSRGQLNSGELIEPIFHDFIV